MSNWLAILVLFVTFATLTACRTSAPDPLEMEGTPVVCAEFPQYQKPQAKEDDGLEFSQ